MKVLFVSNLFPDAAEPNRGIYNARIVHELARLCQVQVFSPRPAPGLPPFWRPPAPRRPRPEDMALSPTFPPYAYIPKIGSSFNHRLMARTLRRPLEAVRKAFPFDVILASWVYPDACAISQLSQSMSFPWVAIAQGSDVHQYLKHPTRRRVIGQELARASAVITRSQELGRLLANEAGLPPSLLHTLYNGVDADVFRPGDPAALRQALGLPAQAFLVLYVGNFLPIKNPLLLVTAHARLVARKPARPIHLVMIGEGPLLETARQQAAAAGSAAHLTLAGRQPPAEVARYMQAADALCVSSDNEGVPNVILEAMACGRRVVATRVGGIPEILTQPFLGTLVNRGDADDLARALGDLADRPADQAAILNHARQFSWAKTAEAYRKLLAQAAGHR